METRKPLSALNLKSAFIVWGPPHFGPRSKVLARELGVDSLHYVYATTRRGAASALFRYGYQAFKTLLILFRERPRLVFVQSPPSFAVLFVYLYCALGRVHYVVDAHSAAFTVSIWSRPAWLQRILARRAITTIVTNDHFARVMQDRGGQTFVLRDIPTSFQVSGTYPMNSGFNVAMVNTFAADEPLREVFEAARRLPDVHFYVTGKKKNAPADMLKQAPANFHFTGFLPEAGYYALLNSAHAVLCLTTRNHTMQRGACEALSLGRPIITSDWPLLREYFNKGTVHVPNTVDGICQGVRTMKDAYAAYQVEIKTLQLEQRREWLQKQAALMTLINSKLGM